MPDDMSRKCTEALAVDPEKSAREAGLKYVSDRGPGIYRRKRGSSLSYVSATGRKVRDAETLQRIHSLAIPPAWREVWICPDPQGHLQATGLDDRGLKQYRYHPRWREVRDETKYDKMIEFAKSLPAIRHRVEQDLARPGLPRKKVLAAVVRLLESSLIRVGNDEYAKDNGSFGLTTMKDRHVKVTGSTMRFRFRGKSGVEHAIDLNDRRLAKIVRRCQDLPGEELFQYIDDNGRICDVGSSDVNEYLKEISGREFSAKDFRTWAGTVLAAMALREYEEFASQRQAKRNVVAAVEAVARRLGNTKAVCRKCYVHPAIIDAYLDRTLVQHLKHRVESRMRKAGEGLPSDEAAVLSLLQKRLTGEMAWRKAG